MSPIKFKKILIAMKGIINLLTRKYSKTNCNRNILLIIEQPGIGDTVLSLNALYNFSRLLSQYSECKLYLAADKNICTFLSNIDSKFTMELIALDFSLVNKWNKNSFYSNIEKLNSKKWDTIIFMDKVGIYGKSLLSNLFYNTVVVTEYTLKNNYFDILYNKLVKNSMVLKFDYRNLLYIHKEMITRVLMKQLGKSCFDNYIKYKIPGLKIAKNITQGKYCVFSTGISKGHAYQYRVWKLGNYYESIKYILAHSDLMVYLVGSSDDIENNNKLYYMFLDESRVINITAQTSFKEWVEVLRHAEFVFGNDSGYIHLSAMLDTQAFVIAGYWNYGRFLPYEKDTEDIKAPIDIRTARPVCTLCNVIKHKCKEKRICDAMVKSEGIYKCIDDITVDDAIAKLEPFLKKEGLYK